MKTLILVLGLVLASLVHAGGERFGVGCVGGCGREEIVVDGQVTCIVVMDNIASDTDVIRVQQMRLTVSHVDGDEVLENILVPVDAGQQAVWISPHSEFQLTQVVRPHPADVGSRLPVRFEAFGDVVFNAFTPNPSTSGMIEFASVGSAPMVLAEQQATCTPPGPVARASVLIRHRRTRHLHPRV